VRFRHQRSSEAEGQTSLLANISPLAKLHQKDFSISEVISELQEIQLDKGHMEQLHWCRG